MKSLLIINTPIHWGVWRAPELLSTVSTVSWSSCTGAGERRAPDFVKPAFAFGQSLWEAAGFEVNHMARPQLNLGPGKRGPGLFDATLGALAGAGTSGIFGLFSVGLYPAIVNRDVSELFRYASLSLGACLICVPIGWFLGWLIGPWFGRRFKSPKVEFAAGVVAGLVPVGAVVLGVALLG
jgi:hypothetical protein